MRQRLVNFELLRIIAMLMVLGLHANFMALGQPTLDDIFTVTGLTRTLLQSLCIIAVNVFVMISGWFGIKPSIKGFCNFMWQVIFCVGGVYLAGTVFFNQPFGVKDLLRCFGLYHGGGWFVASYIGLYIISPILNSYIEKTSIKNISWTLIAFFLFEFLWGNTLSVDFVVGGYSTFSFIGIYILAGVLHKAKIKYSTGFILKMFVLFITLNALSYAITVKLNLIGVRDIIFNYINPIVILASASMVILFNRLTPTFKQKVFRVL